MHSEHHRPPEDESQPLFDSEDMQALTEAPSETSENTAMEAHLWVEKYTPRHFTELLSDDVSHANSPVVAKVLYISNSVIASKLHYCF